MRECGVIALSLLGGAARAFLDEPDSASDREARAVATELLERLLAELLELLVDPRDDVRFQAGPALIEVGEAAVEPALLAALEREQHDEVRENLISSIAQLDPPSQAACDALAEVLASDEGKGWVGWEAALALTAARRPEGAPRLIAALRSRETRDRALEALAVLGDRAGPEAAIAVRRLSKGLLVPVFTRVRAAYALARMLPDEGAALLDRLAKHLRPAVREAVAEARQHLIELGAERDVTDRGAYRRP
jgi:HEAT repeat protein